jgi:hypothetical protein
VETDNPNACATVNWKVCKSAVALYCLYLSVITKECVIEVLINPIIQTRTCRLCHMYHPTIDNMHKFTDSYPFILMNSQFKI